MRTIGHVKTCYGEKFGTPRQPSLVNQAWGELVFEPDFRKEEAVLGLEGFSHVWLLFLFHQAQRDDWKPMVRPPRLGGNDKVGVFASRSPFRPNPIGLSCVRLESIDFTVDESPVLKLRGVDLVDGTPVLDIKPFIAYADTPPVTKSGYAHDLPPELPVMWIDTSASKLNEADILLIEQTLACDPRPAYQNSEREYGCHIGKYNVIWEVVDNVVRILRVEFMT